ncbi:hypothetical protein [Streptomyces sp. NPDC051561]|uniref:hypothetical protein n=1 Tax=Streptomyces sp. NPDC051561 TaxID=3365658 RepID=UPI0037906D82
MRVLVLEVPRAHPLVGRSAVIDRTTLHGKHYLCLVPHKSNSANSPKGAVKFWQRYTT